MGLTLLFIVASLLIVIIVSLNHRNSLIEKSFITGFILAVIALCYVSLTIYSYQTHRVNNVIHLKKYKWTIWIVSISSILILVLSWYEVFYNLQYHLFPQAVGYDQGSYWSANAAFIYLSFYAILLILFANIILLFIPSEKIAK